MPERTFVRLCPDGSVAVVRAIYPILLDEGQPEEYLKAEVYDLATGERRQEFALHRRAAVGLAASPDGSLLIGSVGERSNTTRGSTQVLLWSMRSGALLHRWLVRDGLSRVRFSPDGSRVTAKSGAGIHVWDLETYEAVPLPRDLPSEARAPSLPSRDRLLVHDPAGAAAQLWDLRTGNLVVSLEVGGRAGTPRLSPNSRYLRISGLNGGPMQLFDMKTRRPLF